MIWRASGIALIPLCVRDADEVMVSSSALSRGDEQHSRQQMYGGDCFPRGD